MSWARPLLWRVGVGDSNSPVWGRSPLKSFVFIAVLVLCLPVLRTDGLSGDRGRVSSQRRGEVRFASIESDVEHAEHYDEEHAEHYEEHPPDDTSDMRIVDHDQAVRSHLFHGVGLAELEQSIMRVPAHEISLLGLSTDLSSQVTTETHAKQMSQAKSTSTSRLTVNVQVGEGVVKWPELVQRNITWCIDKQSLMVERSAHDAPSEADLLEEVRTPERVRWLVEMATLAWEDVCNVNFVYVGYDCDAAWFTVKMDRLPGTYAIAPVMQTLNNFASRLRPDLGTTPWLIETARGGIKRLSMGSRMLATLTLARETMNVPHELLIDTLIHEVGHVLGFRHEHIHGWSKDETCNMEDVEGASVVKTAAFPSVQSRTSEYYDRQDRSAPDDDNSSDTDAADLDSIDDDGASVTVDHSWGHGDDVSNNDRRQQQSLGDRESIMGYDFCGSSRTTMSQLSELDKLGAQVVYGQPSNRTHSLMIVTHEGIIDSREGAVLTPLSVNISVDTYVFVDIQYEVIQSPSQRVSRYPLLSGSDLCLFYDMGAENFCKSWGLEPSGRTFEEYFRIPTSCQQKRLAASMSVLDIYKSMSFPKEAFEFLCSCRVIKDRVDDDINSDEEDLQRIPSVEDELFGGRAADDAYENDIDDSHEDMSLQPCNCDVQHAKFELRSALHASPWTTSKELLFSGCGSLDTVRLIEDTGEQVIRHRALKGVARMAGPVHPANPMENDFMPVDLHVSVPSRKSQSKLQLKYKVTIYSVKPSTDVTSDRRKGRMGVMGDLSFDHFGLDDASAAAALELSGSDGAVLKAVTKLTMASNRLTSFPPAEWVSQSRGRLLGGVKELSLRGNRLQSITEALMEAHALQVLHLQRNELSSVPSFLFSKTTFPKLRIVNLAFNQLLTLPRTVSEAPSLTSLDVSNNKLVHMMAPPPPSSLSTDEKQHRIAVASDEAGAAEKAPSTSLFPSLTVLSISYNAIVELPHELCAASHLRLLSASRNQLEQLPACLSQCKELVDLLVSKNIVTEIPALTLPNLRTLVASQNNLTRVSGEVFSHARKSITTVGLHENNLESLPPQLFQLESIVSLHLASNQLTSLPTELSKMTSLRSLDLRNNRLSTLPPLGDLSHLKSLHVAMNRLTRLEPWLSNLQLSHFSAQGNALEHVTFLPSSKLARTLRFLSLSNNRLKETPPSITNLSWLVHLDLSRNSLRSIDNLDKPLHNLQVLKISRNDISVMSKDVICSFGSLVSIDASSNNLTSTPPCNFTSLRTVNLNFNRIKEEPWFGSRNTIEDIQIKGSRVRLVSFLSVKNPSSSVKAIDVSYLRSKTSSLNLLDFANAFPNLQVLRARNCRLLSISSTYGLARNEVEMRKLFGKKYRSFESPVLLEQGLTVDSASASGRKPRNDDSNSNTASSSMLANLRSGRYEYSRYATDIRGQMAVSDNRKYVDPSEWEATERVIISATAAASSIAQAYPVEGAIPKAMTFGYSTVHSPARFAYAGGSSFQRRKYFPYYLKAGARSTGSAVNSGRHPLRVLDLRDNRLTESIDALETTSPSRKMYYHLMLFNKLDELLMANSGFPSPLSTNYRGNEVQHLFYSPSLQHNHLSMPLKMDFDVIRWAFNQANLEYLNVALNKMSILPYDTELPHLKTLIATNNYLSFMPSWMMDLQELEVLDLGFNRLEYVVDNGQKDKWQNLRNLNMENNLLTYIPEWIFDLPRLERLKLSNNVLSSLPASFPPRLVWLEVRANMLTAIPPQMFNATHLRGFHASLNSISDFPDICGIDAPARHSLVTIILNNNNLDKISDLTCLHKLEHLNLRGNNLRDIPGDFSKLGRLRDAHLDGNFLRRIPKRLFFPRKLRSVTLRSNDIQKLDQHFSNSIRNVDLSDNRITALPDIEPGSSGMWKSLVDEFSISENRLEHIGRGWLESTAKSDFSHNFITSLPPLDSVRPMSHVLRCDVSHNLLTSLPESFANVAIESLDVSYNRIAALPSWTPAVTNSTYYPPLLDFTSNNISSVPAGWVSPQLALRLRIARNPLRPLPPQPGVRDYNWTAIDFVESELDEDLWSCSEEECERDLRDFKDFSPLPSPYFQGRHFGFVARIYVVHPDTPADMPSKDLEQNGTFIANWIHTRRGKDYSVMWKGSRPIAASITTDSTVNTKLGLFGIVSFDDNDSDGERHKSESNSDERHRKREGAGEKSPSSSESNSRTDGDGDGDDGPFRAASTCYITQWSVRSLLSSLYFPLGNTSVSTPMTLDGTRGKVDVVKVPMYVDGAFLAIERETTREGGKGENVSDTTDATTSSRRSGDRTTRTDLSAKRMSSTRSRSRLASPPPAPNVPKGTPEWLQPWLHPIIHKAPDPFIQTAKSIPMSQPVLVGYALFTTTFPMEPVRLTVNLGDKSVVVEMSDFTQGLQTTSDLFYRVSYYTALEAFKRQKCIVDTTFKTIHKEFFGYIKVEEIDPHPTEHPWINRMMERASALRVIRREWELSGGGKVTADE